MRKKKTPEELAAEAEQEELDDFTSKTVPLILSNIFLILLYYELTIFN